MAIVRADLTVQSHELWEGEALGSFRSAKSVRRLNQVDRVRASGIGDHISLPQLVVCGDQSSGKSSVLEGLTGIPFPRQEGTCTKFATEIILRHSPHPLSITATILPHGSQDDKTKARLLAFKRQMDDFTQLPDLISDAAVLMGVAGSDSIQVKRTFSRDALRLEVTGSTGLHLTVVDLPGLIAVNEDNEDDVDLVTNLVQSYLKSSRTVILAVVQAGNDVQNQSIIQKARKYDPSGSRTVGIITKPDLINKHSEARVVRLAKNQDTVKLKLGFFLVKNPSPSDISEGWSASNRGLREAEYFSAEQWQSCSIDMTRAGIDNLRVFLQQLLNDHIEKELPKVRTEIKGLLDRIERELQELGEERPTTAHHRSFLTHLSMGFYNLTRSALDGNYFGADGDFFENEDLETSTRLRARIHSCNSDFADYMRENAKARVIRSTNQGIANESESGVEGYDDDQKILTKEQMTDWVMKVCRCAVGDAAF